MLPDGTKIRGYRIVRPIGSGSFGDVFQATNEKTEETVALKVSSQPNREFAVLQQLEHPHIVAVVEEFHHDLGHVLVMTHVDGQSLAELLQSGHDQPTRSLVTRNVRAVLQVAEALSHAHARGICHRDVKPENILIDAAGQATLIDWGVATSIDAAEPDDAIVGGTLAYLPTADVARFAGLSPHSPTSRSFANVYSKSLAQEAARSAERADIFAIGVILHEVATGSLPFPPPIVDESIVAAAREALANRRDLPDRVRRNVNIPASLRAIIAGCFAEPEGESNSPAGHYESMLQLSEDLSAYINARPLLHVREGFAASAKRQLRRHRKALVTLASLALVLFASFVADRWMAYSEIQSVRDYAIEMVEASEVEERLPAGLSNSLFNSGYFPDSATLIQSRATACHEAGVAFLRRDRPAEAVRLLTLAHRIQPNNGECLNDLGAAQFNTRDFAGAIDSFNMALKLPCDHAAVLSNRGAAFAAMDLPQQARDDFLKALKLVPDHREATFHLKLLEETMAPDSTSISTEHRPQRLPEYLSP